MNNEILVVISDGSEEMEAVIVIDILRRASLNVIVAGTSDVVNCSRNIKIVPDKQINDIDENEIFSAIILPGGLQGVTNLLKSANLHKILINNNRNNSIIAAVCAAPIILKEWDLIPSDCKITSYPSVKNQLDNYNYSDEKVIVCNNIITSRAAGTTFDFAFKLVEQLKDLETSNKIKNDILFTN